MAIIELIFFLSLLLIIYTYVGYYVILVFIYILSKKKRNIKNGYREKPQVSFLIAAYNEEKNIIAKIKNIFKSNYPPKKISIYVVSDASTDRTNEFVTSFKDERVHLIVSADRQGKTLCENLGLKKIQADIVVFTDASTTLDEDCLYNLVKHFNSKEIGCVSTRDESIKSEKNRGENLYVRYEMAVRAMESRVDSLVGLSGSCYAARKDLCMDLPEYVTRDFALPLIAKEKGYISVDEPEAICFVKTTGDPKKEFNRKIRTFTNGILTLFYKKNLLNIFVYGKFSFILWSHKLFRWLLPFFFLSLLLSNVILSKMHYFFIAALFFQVLFYFMAYCGGKTKSEKLITKLSKVFHFMSITNVASIMAWYNFFTGNKCVKWEPTKR